jgi:hypothetical protein
MRVLQLPSVTSQFFDFYLDGAWDIIIYMEAAGTQYAAFNN